MKSVKDYLGPTNFSPYLRHILERIKIDAVKLQYHIVIIICDGDFEDEEEVQKLIVESSHLPMTVLIGSVGKVKQ